LPCSILLDITIAINVVSFQANHLASSFVTLSITTTQRHHHHSVVIDRCLALGRYEARLAKMLLQLQEKDMLLANTVAILQVDHTTRP
jgi:hypothetical protein